MGQTAVGIEVIVPAIELAHRLRGTAPYSVGKFSPDSIFEKGVRNMLSRVDDAEVGCPMDSGDEDEEEIELDQGGTVGQVQYRPQNAACEEQDGHGQSNVLGDNDDVLHFEWKSERPLRPPIGITTGRKTAIRPEFKTQFNSPISSFLSFVPLKIWKLMTHHSNQYACQEMASWQESAGESTCLTFLDT